jgi:alpha,alpha-trehalase
MMIELLAAVVADESVYTRYFVQLKKEYEFWMSGADQLGAGQAVFRRVAKVGDALLNRYWDDAELPREESYAEDIALAGLAGRDAAGLYRDIRAACESGWDFSSRWFEDPHSIASIRTTGMLPIDLNSILHRVEVVLGDISERNGDRRAARFYKDRATRRKSVIQAEFFDEREGFFVDLILADRTATKSLSLAAAYPLFFGLATKEQAARVSGKLKRDFLRPGGWVTTLSHTDQQWDAPNGWAPLQWIVCKGLCNYGFNDEARTGAARWIENNLGTYRDCGRFMEKYNVEKPGLVATGGEYAVQDGFGWTNGVLLGLQNRIC